MGTNLTSFVCLIGMKKDYKALGNLQSCYYSLERESSIKLYQGPYMMFKIMLNTFLESKFKTFMFLYVKMSTLPEKLSVNIKWIPCKSTTGFMRSIHKNIIRKASQEQLHTKVSVEKKQVNNSYLLTLNIKLFYSFHKKNS